MVKREKINIDELGPLFEGKGVDNKLYSDEKLLGIIRNPSSFEEIPVEQKLNFWMFVVERMKESPDFREEVHDTLEGVWKEGE